MQAVLDAWVSRLELVEGGGQRALICAEWFDSIKELGDISPDQWRLLRLVNGIAAEEMREMLERIDCYFDDPEIDGGFPVSMDEDEPLGDELARALFSPLPEIMGASSHTYSGPGELASASCEWTYSVLGDLMTLSINKLTSEWAVLLHYHEGWEMPLELPRPLGLVSVADPIRSAALVLHTFGRDEFGNFFIDEGASKPGKDHLPDIIRIGGMSPADLYRLLLASSGYAKDDRVIRMEATDLVRLKPRHSKAGFRTVLRTITEG